METFEAFFVKARNGDIAAFGELVRRFQSMAFGYAHSLLGDFHHAQDATQEAFIEVYRNIQKLRVPAAFPGWLRKTVFKQCNRIMRKGTISTIPFDDLASPARESDATETWKEIVAAITDLSSRQREAITLFYINGYSEREVAEFLDVPESTVKKRLYDGRNKLRERMVGMVSESLKKNAPDERFSLEIIHRLLAGVSLLDMPDHPVAKVFETVCKELADYERLQGDEVVAETEIVDPWSLQFAYHPDAKRVLRTGTTHVTLNAIRTRRAPVRVLTAGRVFLHQAPHVDFRDITHTMDIVCVDKGVTLDDMKATIHRVVNSVLPDSTIVYVENTFHWFDPCLNYQVLQHGVPVDAGGGSGFMTAKTLRDAGHDPDVMGGFAFNVMLERFAAVAIGLENVARLWEPPFLKV